MELAFPYEHAARCIQDKHPHPKCVSGICSRIAWNSGLVSFLTRVNFCSNHPQECFLASKVSQNNHLSQHLPMLSPKSQNIQIADGQAQTQILKLPIFAMWNNAL